MDIIQLVSVVPIFAPIITLIALVKVSRFAHINHNTKSVTIVLLCKIAVPIIPVNIPFMRVFVDFSSKYLTYLVPMFLMLSEKICIPYKKNASQPINVRIEKIESVIMCYLHNELKCIQYIYIVYTCKKILNNVYISFMFFYVIYIK